MIIEAWGSTRVACLEEAVLALVESFADVGDAAVTARVPISVGAAGDDMLVSLLEDVIYTIDARDAVPVAVDLDERADGGVDGSFSTVPSEQVDVIGAIPKGVSRSDLQFARYRGQWRCHVVVDV